MLITLGVNFADLTDNRLKTVVSQRNTGRLSLFYRIEKGYTLAQFLFLLSNIISRVNIQGKIYGIMQCYDPVLASIREPERPLTQRDEYLKLQPH